MLMEAIDSLGLLWKWCETNRTLERLSPHCAVYIQGLIRQWGKSLCATSSTAIRKGLRATPSSEPPSSHTKLFPFENETFHYKRNVCSFLQL